MISYPVLGIIIIICFGLKALFGGFKKEKKKVDEQKWTGTMTDEQYDFWNDPKNWQKH